MSDDNPSAGGEFAVGSQIAGYLLEEQIGRGGMAVVYRAHDARLDRRVALKILAPGLALDEAFRQRFIRESRAAAAVDHPHIIPVFEAGEANGVLFIAMRYVQGRDARTLLDRGGPLQAARAIEIITQVASALDAAHAHGLVHRDVKPGNMLLDSSSGSGHQDHVYLSDFGLSKQSLAVTGLTSTGQFLGTLDYVAPEQIEGRPVDGQADQYALACASFELLCGAPPFRRDEGLAVVWAQLSAAPPSLHARRADLPVGVDEVLAKAMAKSPADRYPSCLAFAAALREALGVRRSGPPAAPPARPPTEVAMPVHEAAARADHPPDRPADRAAAAGPATQAARITPRPTTRPGLTEPPGAYEPGAGPGGYPPPSGQGGYPPPPGPGGYRRRRPWWRSPAVLIIACVVVLGGASFAVFGMGRSASGHGGGTTGHAAAVTIPACTTAVAAAAALPKVRTASVGLSAEPFAVSVTPDGKWLFATLVNSIALLSNGSSLAPSFVRTISAPGVKHGQAITHNGRYLLAAAGSGAVVIDVAAAEQGSANPIIGTLTSTFGKGAVEVAISPNDRFAFVTLQSSADMVVFNLRSALGQGFGPSDVVGKIRLEQQPVGMAISPDGNWLYATSMERTKTPNPSQGTVTVIDVHRAEVTPGSSVISTVTAGCSPVRVIAAPDSSDVWVTDRESDALVGFSAAKLRTDPSHALVARVTVGEAPIGLIMVNGGSRILVADTNYKNLPGETASVAVVSTSAALAGGHALLGLVKTGLVPREFGLAPDGKTVFVTNNGSQQLQAIDVGSLP